MDDAFRTEMAAGYAFGDEEVIVLGSPIIGDEVLPDVRVQVPLSRINRHGLIAGRHRDRQDQDPPAPRRPALRSGRPGLRGGHQGRPHRPGAPGDPANPNVVEPLRVPALGVPGRRATPSSSCPSPASSAPRSGPASTPSGRSCWARSWTSTRPRPRSCRWSSSTATTSTCRCWTWRTCGRRSSSWRSDDGKAVLEDYGGMSRASLGVILRSIVTLEQEGADVFFGEPEFDVDDLLRTSLDGQGHRHAAGAVGRHGPARGCSARSCSGCWPSCTRRCRRRATCRSRSWPSSSTRRTCCSRTPPRR